MPTDRSSFFSRSARALRQALPWALTLAVATCTTDRTGPSDGGTGYFSFNPVYQGVSGSLARFGIVADSVHVRLTRPIDELVLDTTVFFHPDSAQLSLALPIELEQSPESLSAIIEIRAGATLLFVDSLDVQVFDGPPGATEIPTVLLDYVGPGSNMAVLTLIPDDTTIAFGDTLFFDATAEDSSAQSIADFYVAWSTSNPAIATINGEGRLIAPSTRTSLQIIGETPTGIADTTLVTFAPIPNAILADSGNSQAGLVGDSLGALFVARVMAADAQGVPGIPVRFDVATGGGNIRDTVLVTDAQGRVRTRGLFSTTAGAHSWTATVIGTAITTTFTATANAGAPSAIAIQGGNLQVDSAGRALPNPFAARVTDAFTNPVPGVKIYWARTLGNGTLAADSTFTDATGVATVGYTLGAVGLDSVTATIAGTGAFVTFQATAINGAPSVVNKVLGDAQAATVGTLLADSFAVTVRSATNQPVVGSPVAWTVLRGGSVSLDTTLTDVNGRAAVTYTLGGAPGIDSVRAQAGGASAVFTADAQTGVAASIAIVSGNDQIDTLLTAIDLPFVVRVSDALTNPVAGEAVAFSVITGTGTLFADTVLTNLNGEVAVGYLLGGTPGIDSIRATLVGTGGSVDFALTVVAGVPTAINEIAGNLQFDTAHAVLATPMQVRVLDARGNPVPGAEVTFAGTGGLTAQPAVDTADLNGDVSALITLGDSAGSWQMTATVTGVPVATSFDLTTNAAQAALIAIVSGDGQTDSTGNALPLPFVARVTDAYGNPVPGAAVLWQVQVGSGNATDDTTFTDITGHTQVNYVFGVAPGTETVRATLVGTSAFVDFTANAVSGAPAFLVAISGENQVDTVLSTLADSLVVELRDAGNNPVPGEWLYWTTAGMFVSADSSLTDANGRAAVQVTYDSIAFQGVVLAHTVDTLIGIPFVLRIEAGLPAQLTPIGGNAQTAEISTTLPDSLRVFVQDAYGNPADSALVTFTVTSGSGTVVPDTAMADSIGMAVASYTLGNIAGTDTILAQLVAQPASFPFTATGTSAAPGALVYVSGTGQTATVAQPLGAPFVVEVRDASTNPVAGAWVRWSVVAGGGVVAADSSLTIGDGSASVGYTLGTLAGVDSILATVDGVADTIAFYAVGTPDAAATFVKVSGDSQSAAAASPLASPLVVRLTDQYGNPIAAAAIDFAVGPLSGTVDSATATTDAAGFANSGTWTLGDSGGTQTVRATTALVPADTITFVATAIPSGTSATWTGALSSDFGTAGNWSPAVVPGGADNVFIPDAVVNDPVLGGSVILGGLVVESGASMTIGTNTLALGGDVVIDGTVTRTGNGMVQYQGSGFMEGTVPVLRVINPLTLSGDLTITDSLTLSGTGTLTVAGSTLTVGGDLSGTSGQLPSMLNPLDSVDVGGTVRLGAGGVWAPTAGVFVMRGPVFDVFTTATVSTPAAAHRVVFAGSGSQQLRLANAGLTLNRLGSVDVTNPAGVVLTDNAAFSGAVRLLGGGVTSQVAQTATIGGGLEDTFAGWQPVTTILVAGSVLPDSIVRNVTIGGSLTLPSDLRIKGTVGFTGASLLTLGGNALRLDSTLTISGTGSIVMQNAADTLEVQGAVLWNGSTTGGLLTAGTIIARGGFSASTASSTFQPTGTHTTIFAGSVVQNVNFPNNNGVAGNRFQNAVFNNAAGVSFASAAYITGDAEVQAGLITGSGANVSIQGTLIDPTNGGWRPTTTTFTGVPATFPDTIISNVVFTGTNAVGLTGDLRVTRSLSFIGSGASFNLNGFNLWGDSTLNVSGTHQIIMQNPADTFEVAQGVTWNGSTAGSLMTAGTLILRGNFGATTASSTFQPVGTHTTIFAGSALQTISFPNNNGVGGNRFENVTFANPAGVSFTSGAYITGDADVQAGAVTGSGVTVSIQGTLIDPANGAWTPTTTTFTGVPTSFPDTIVSNVVLNAGVSVGLAKDLRIKRALSFTGSGGSIALNGFNLWADSTLTVSGTHQIIMQNPADTLEVQDGITWNGSTAGGLLTDGTVIARGSFGATTASSTFQGTGNHTVVFAGSAPQTISFPNNNGVSGNRFQNVTFANPAGVSFTSGAYITGNAAVQAGAVTGSGVNVSIGGTLLDPANGAWTPTTTTFTGIPASFPDTIISNVHFTGAVGITLGQDLRITRSLTFSGSSAASFTLNGFDLRGDSTLTITGSHQVIMQNAADTLEIAEGITWNGSTAAGLLTAGTVIARGSFGATTASTTFQPTGTHTVVLAGSALQSVSFPNNNGVAGNRFMNVTFANASGVSFTSGAYITGDADVQAGAVTGSAVNVSIEGTLIDPANGAWTPTTTTFTGIPASFPDTIVSNVDFDNLGTITLAKDLRVTRSLTFSRSGGIFDLGGFNLWADSTLTINSGHQVVMQNVADTLEVAEGITWAGSSTAGLLTAGTVIARGDFSAPVATTTFQPTGTHTVVFAGTATQNVGFPNNNGSTSNRFQNATFANAAGVNFTSDAYITGIADVQAGTVTAPGWELALGGTLLDPANGAWQPTVMSYRGVPTSFPDTLNTTVNFTAVDTITLVKDLRVKGALVFIGNSGARFEMNGFNLWADSSFYIISAHQFVMQNAADTLEVEDEISWTGSTTPGLLTAGTIIAHGDFTAPSSSATFTPSGSHKTVFAAGIHSVTFPNNRSFTGNRFHHMEMVNPSTVTIGSEIFVAGTFSNVAGPTGTLMSAGQVVLNTRGLAVNNLNFDQVRIAYSGPAAFQLDNATFLNQDPAQTQVAIRTAGGLSVAISGANFTTTPTTGRYISATDTLANATPVILAMVGSTPLDGSAFELENVANDGATIDWSTLAFALQPLDAVLGSFLDTVTVVALGPNGDTLIGYTGNVTVALGANPGNASLSGTTTVAAIAGVATFTDLGVDSVGTGYTLTAGTGDLATVTSSLFNISVFQPVGFDVVWVGGTSTDWHTPSNWNTGIVPDENTNVYISSGFPNDPTISVQDTVNRLWVGPGAMLTFDANLAADSSIEFDGSRAGVFALHAIGTGALRGGIGYSTQVSGTYEIIGTVTGFDLQLQGQLTIGADTLALTYFQATGSGQLVMNDPAALMEVVTDVGFNTSVAGTGMTDGTLRVSGNISAYGGTSNPFAPSGDHVTEFVGTGTQTVDFFNPDPVTGSRFANVVFNGTGTVEIIDRVHAFGTVSVQQGAVVDTFGIVAHQGFTMNGGAVTLSELRTGGPLTLNGGTYTVGTTTFFGAGAAIAIPVFVYDTLQIERAVTLAGATGVAGDLRILGPTDPARLDVAGNTLTVDGSVIINGDAALIMQNALDTVLVTGSFSVNGASTDGLLTAGWLRIGGSFLQSSDGSGEAFRAGTNHTTEFYFAGPTGRTIEFASPSGGPASPTGSHFGALLMPIGFDTLIGRVPAAGKMFIAAATIQDTTQLSNVLVGYDSVVVSSASPTLQLRTLEVWGGLEVQGGVPYDVVNTRLLGGPNGTLPALAYQNLLLANTEYTLGAPLTLPGSLDVGIFCSEVCFSSGGQLTLAGHDLIVGGDLGVMGLGQLVMAAGDSVDVTGDATWRTTSNDGLLTGGTLVVRAMFNTVGFNTFQASAAHRTVMLAPVVEDIYPTSGLRFGSLVLLDAFPRRIRSSEPVVVLDSLIISANSGLNDTLGFSTGAIHAQGPVFTAVGSSIRMDGSVRFDHNDILVNGSYVVANTIFGGNGQLVPTSLTYNNVQVRGPYVYLNAPLDIANSQFLIDGSAGPAEFDINGYSVAVGDFTTTGQGTLLSTDIGSGLLVRGDATFNGGDQTGKLTEGGITFLGFFTQDSLTSLSSYVSSGNHATVFADSSFGGSQAVLNSMSETTSRFNDVSVYGNGVLFWNQAWVMGDLRILDPMVDSVSGTALSLFGDLVDAVDANRRYRVDTTNIRGAHPLLPDSIDGNVLFFAPDSLEQTLRIGGHLTIFDTLIPHPGGTLRVDSLFATTANGLLVMTHPTQRVEIEGNAFFDGATSTGWLTAGVLKTNGGLFRGLANPLAFDATGSHTVYVDSMSNGRVVNFDGPGGGLQNLRFGSVGLTLNSDLLVRGDISVDGEVPTPIFSSNRLLTVHGLVEQMVIFDNTRVAIPEQNTLFDVTFQNMDLTADQLTVFGDGSPEPLQLGAIRFLTVPTTGNLLRLVDTLADADSLIVEMMSSTPAQGDAYTAVTGDARAAWPKLVLNAFPTTVDSAVAFTITVGIMNPDSTVGTTSIGNATIALEANPQGNTLGGTTNIAFNGVSASFNDLTLLLPGAGTSFRVSIDGRPTDTLVTPTLDILNPAPAGAVVFDNGGGDNLWSTATNWSTDAVPTETDSVFIPGTVAVFYDVANDTVGTLVLGAGAQLDMQASTNLTLTGRLAAGNTITGSGTLFLDGAITEVSGTIFPATYITGQVNALGTATFNNGLTVDGAGAEFNIAGAVVTVNGIFGTSNGGTLTMDSPEDTLIVGDAFFNGGSTFNRLTAGTLILQGSDLSASGPSPSSFAATGTHTVVFEDAGDNSNISLLNSDSSYFQNLTVRTPNSVLVSTPTARLTVFGNLELDDDGALTGDTLGVGGYVTMGGASSNLTLGLLTIGGNGNLIQGSYNVSQTQYVGTGQDVAGGTYQALGLSGTAQFLNGDITARSIFATNGSVDVNGVNLHVDTLFAGGTGVWVMDAPADSVVVDSMAWFTGGNTTGLLTAGYLELRGGMLVGSDAVMFRATPGHLTRFAGPAAHGTDFPFEGFPIWFGDLIIDSTTVNIFDAAQVTGDLTLQNGVWSNSAGDALIVNGDVTVTGAAGALDPGILNVGGALDFSGGTAAGFLAPMVRFFGTGQTIPQLPYAGVEITGTASPVGDLSVASLSIESGGVLNLAGNRVDVAGGGFIVRDSSHLLMQDPGDTLWVAGTATFEGSNSTGDYTAGAIRAGHFIAQTGISTDQRSFVQQGSNRIVPMAGDTIAMWNGGQVGSHLKTLVLDGVGGTVHLGSSNLWIADSLVIVGALDSLNGLSGTGLLVGFPGGNVGTVSIDQGALAVASLAVAGPLSMATGTYNVPLTTFSGAGQTIPGNVPYQDVEVQYAAALGGDLDMSGDSTRFQIGNFGDLDLAGHRLAVDSFFLSSAFAVLRMDSIADTLRAEYASFDGGNTNGLLTAGEFEVGTFYQGTSYSGQSFAASGTHQTTFIDIGGTAESGRDITFFSPGSTLSRFARVRFLANDGNRLWSDIYALDTLLVNNSLHTSISPKITAAGPVILGVSADLQADTLRLGDTLILDPSAGTFGLNNTVFGPTAKTPPEWPEYGNVFLEGNLTLQDSLHFVDGVTVREGAVLTLNGNNFTTEYGFELRDSARLVMAAGDTLFTGHANWGAGPTGTDLAGGLIRMSGQFFQFGDPQSFAPTGTVVEFAGGFPQSVQFSSPGASYFRDWRIIGKQMYMNTHIRTEGDLFIDSTAAIVDWSIGGMEFMGKVTVETGGSLTDPDATGTQIAFHDSLNVGTPANFSVPNAVFRDGDYIPDLPYTNLFLEGGVDAVLANDLTTTGLLGLQPPSGSTNLTLNGHTVTVGGAFYAALDSRITMTNVADQLNITGNASFDGADLTGALTAGTIRIGGHFDQAGGTSTRSFASSGTRTEFFGGGTHSVTFANPGVTLSHFQDLTVVDIGTSVNFLSTASVLGEVTVNDGGSVTAANDGANIYWFGKVRVLGSAAITNPNLGLFTYHDSLIVATPANYSVVNTAFQATNAVPVLPYTNLYLNEGVHDTLTADLTVNGVLSLSAVSAGGQDLVLNTHTVNALTLITQNEGRFTMADPTDSLLVSGNATFGGGDVSGRLTAGVLSVGGDFSQQAAYSDKSFRSTGTLVEFSANGSPQNVAFATPDSSYFGTVSAPGTSLLSLAVTGRMIATGSVGAYTTLLAGDTILAGTISAGPGSGAVTLDALSTGTLTGSYGTYTVASTTLTGAGAVPNLPYDTLVLSSTHTISGGPVISASAVVLHGNLSLTGGGELSTVGDVTVDGSLTNNGGTLTVGRDFSLITAGSLISQNALSGMSVGRDAYFTGGNQAGLMTAGGMDVSGNLTSGGGTSWHADSLFIVAFGGGGNHTITLGNPIAQPFGELSIGAETAESDTLTLTGSLIRTYRFSATSTPRIISNGTELQTERLSVDGAIFQRVAVNVSTSSAQPQQFDNVTFTGYNSADIQMQMTHWGLPTPAVFNFSNVTFDTVADGISGFYLYANDGDGTATDTLIINMLLSPHHAGADGTGAARTFTDNGAVVNYVVP